MEDSETKESSNCGLSEAPPVPRLIHLFKWPTSPKFGFAQKDRKIIKIEEDSPASATGLNLGDVIVEINSRNVTSKGTEACNTLICDNLESLMLLVVDPVGYEYYTSRNISITGNMSTISYRRTPGWENNTIISTHLIQDLQKKIRSLEKQQDAFEEATLLSLALIGSASIILSIFSLITRLN